MKVWFSIIASLILLSSVQGKAEETYAGEVSFIYTDPKGGAQVVLKAKQHCNGDSAVIYKESPIFSEMYSMMLGAFLSGKSLRLYLRPDCNGNVATITHGGIY